MEFPKDFGNQGQWIPATPAKPIPVMRPAPMPMPPAMSDSSWFSSIDVNGQSPALGSASRGQQIDGRGGGDFNSVGVSRVSGIPWSVPNREQCAALNAPVRRQRQQIDGRGGGEINSVDVNRVSGIPWSVPSHRQSAALGSASRGQQTAGRCGGELGTLGTLVFNSEGISHMPYTRLLATSDPTIMSKMNLPPFMIARIGGAVGSSSISSSQGMNAERLSQNQSMLNGKTLLLPNREHGNTRSLPQWVPKPQNRTPFSFLPNLNALPENNMASRVVSEAMASPATPATVEKNQRERIQGLKPPEIIDLDLFDETTSYQDLLRNESSKLPQRIEDKPVEQCSSNQVESSQVVNSQHQEGERNVAINSSEEVAVQQAGEENQGIDLNKTPPPKLRRRKYTPKVIRERKPARTPKSATPKPPKTTENPSGKRKYVRKKKDTSPQDTPSKPEETSSKPIETDSTVLGDIVDQDSRSRNKSVRRSLNFDLEDSQAVDQSSGSGPMLFRQNTLATQGPETHAGAETVVSSRSSLAVHFPQLQGTSVLENSMGSGIRLDLNGSTNQVIQVVNEHVRIPQTPNQPPQPSRLDLLKAKWQADYESMVKNMNQSQQPVRREGENVKKLARMMNCPSTPGNHGRHLQDGQNLAASNRISDVQGEKRKYNLVDNAQVAETGIVQPDNGSGRVSGNYNGSSTNPCFPDFHKRRRVQNGQQELTRNASSLLDCTPPSGWKTIHTPQSTSEVFTFADAQRSTALGKRQSLKQMLGFDQIERETYDRLVQDQRLISTPMMPSGQNKMDCNQPPTPEKASGSSDGQENGIYGPQSRVEVLIANQTKPKVRRRKKEQDPLVNSMAANTNQVENATAASQIGPSLMTESAQQKSSKRAAHLESSFTQDCHISRSYKASARSGFRSGALVSYRDPMEEIVRKLWHLNISGAHECATVQSQNALVPYAGESSMMIPFEGPFNFLKRRKPRPKVDLDPESNRVWKLLMGKDDGEGEEGTNMDKEKWWEEERRVFRGRADSFIARMHLIQGDRRFSRWKGSVVDSVIGVFLTQNVSDHLSSSAFMCLAARFPPQSAGNNKTASVENISRPIVVNATSRWQGEVSEPEICAQSSPGINASKQMHNKEMDNSNESLGSITGAGYVGYSKESSLDFHDIEQGTGHESPDSGSGTAATVTSCTSVVEGDDRKLLEDVVSSQNSVASSQNSSECPGRATDRSKPSPLLNFEADELLAGGRGNGFSSFRELLEMADGKVLNDLKATGNERIILTEHGMIDWSAALQIDKSSSVPNGYAYLNGSGPSIYTSNSHIHQAQHDFSNLSCAPSSSYCYQNFLSSRFVGMEKADVINESNQSYLPPSAFELNQRNINEMMGRQYGSCTGSSTNVMNQKEPLIAKVAPRVDSFGPVKKNPAQMVTSSGIGVRPLQTDKHSSCQSVASSKQNVSSICLNQQDGNGFLFQQRESEAELHTERSKKAVETQAEIQNCGTVQPCSSSHNANQRNDLVPGGATESNLRNEAYTTQKVSAEMQNNASNSKKVKVETDKKTYDWDSLRKQVYHNSAKKERNSDAMDSLDYEAVRNADVNEISNTIRERGMNNMLAERIKDFLNRLVRDHGSTDLEWLRDVPPDKAKDYLLSIRGLGLKSVECVRLLTLHHLAFPVDTNVGRICVRLGWVPLQPLPESLQLHLLEMYPMLETIQKYLWPRLCKLDQRTLYELHYQLITFGKVFCTKSKPNCNACPMRGECKHFASAFASARLALPGPEEKHLVSSTTPLSSDRSHGPVSNPMPLPQLESTHLQEQGVLRNCEPIIEEPTTPEPECIETSEIDIEDAFYNDPDEIPTIKLNFEEFTQNLQNYMQENILGLQDGDMSKALVAITPEAASIPTPKLKNVNRLRTEHQVYELPDSHPLLEGLDKREPDDPCPYLLAIWTPGETAQSTDLPTSCCDAQDISKLCDKRTCFSCNSIREAQAQMVRGTLLIPCRTANRGSFPLNGTYFQVNEVFADHDSSRNPIDVPRDWIWNLPRRTVYFGTSIPTIFKGLTTEGIQHCFWRGFVCVRGFDRTSRAPRPLFARLHFPASKVTRNKKTGAATKEEG